MRSIEMGGARWDDNTPQEAPDDHELTQTDDDPMPTRTVRMPESLTERMEAFWSQHVKPLTGRQYNLSAASRYLIAVGLWAVCHGHWQVKAEPSDRLELP